MRLKLAPPAGLSRLVVDQQLDVEHLGSVLSIWSRQAEIGLPNGRIVLKRFGGAFAGDAAVFQEIAAVRDLQALLGVLLDQENAVPSSRIRPIVRNSSLRHDRRQPERGLVEQQDIGRRHQRAADRKHLLLAAAHRAGGLVEPLGQAREQREHMVEAASLRRRARGAANAPSRRFSRTVSSPNNARPSGTSARPASTMRCGRMAEMSMPRNCDAAAGFLADHPGQRFQERRLAGAIGSDDHDDLAGRDR